VAVYEYLKWRKGAGHTISWPLKLRKTLWRYTNAFIIIIIIFLAHQHKACRQLKIKQEMTAVGDYFKPTSTKPQAGKLG